MAKTLGICGDSWFAATVNGPDRDCAHSEGRHFSEILSSRLGWNLHTLARGAVSNSTIRLQMARMIEEPPDFLIIGTTTANRIEYPRYFNRQFDPRQGINNIVYEDCPDQSRRNVIESQAVTVSNTLNNIFGNDVNHAPVRSEQQRNAIRDYYMEIFDQGFREQQDSWIIASGISAIRSSCIPYLLLAHPWMKLSGLDLRYPQDLLWDPGPGRHHGCIPWALGVSGTRRWHTDDSRQQDIAESLFNYIKDNQLIRDI
jgi:hypothetical protein